MEAIVTVSTVLFLNVADVTEYKEVLTEGNSNLRLILYSATLSKHEIRRQANPTCYASHFRVAPCSLVGQYEEMKRQQQGASPHFALLFVHCPTDLFLVGGLVVEDK